MEIPTCGTAGCERGPKWARSAGARKCPPRRGGSTSWSGYPIALTACRTSSQELRHLDSRITLTEGFEREVSPIANALYDRHELPEVRLHFLAADKEVLLDLPGDGVRCDFGDFRVGIIGLPEASDVQMQSEPV